MEMTAFKKLITVAAITSFFAGLLLTLVQQVQVAPLIMEAESYELTAPAGHHEQATGVSAEHEHGGWLPQDGWERNLFTAGANIVVALGFALLLGAAIELRGARLDWRSGLLWGLAGYAVFFAAPSLGLPPEVPGAQTAPLMHRQTWWLATAICTAIGLALLVFSARSVAKLLGFVLLVTPHLVGAPQAEFHSSTAPAELSQAFIIATVIVNAVFWLSLGGFYAFFQKRVN